MILTGPSRSFFKKRFFQKHPILRKLVRLFLILILPLLLAIGGYILAFNFIDLYFGPYKLFGELLYLPFTFIPLISGFLFYLWLDKD